LGFNQISSINPSSLSGLYSLQELYLDNNKITDISESIFKDLIELKFLNMKNNKIVAFNKDSLFGLYWLEKICMYGNPITTQFPELVNNICSSIANPKCEVVITVICQI
jgi:Leucine-rich repeat (LRR) protein